MTMHMVAESGGGGRAEEGEGVRARELDSGSFSTVTLNERDRLTVLLRTHG